MAHDAAVLRSDAFTCDLIGMSAGSDDTYTCRPLLYFAKYQQLHTAMSASHLDGDAQHEAEKQLVLLKQAPAYIAVEGVGHKLHKGGNSGC